MDYTIQNYLYTETDLNEACDNIREHFKGIDAIAGENIIKFLKDSYYCARKAKKMF